MAWQSIKFAANTQSAPTTLLAVTRRSVLASNHGGRATIAPAVASNAFGMRSAPLSNGEGFLAACYSTTPPSFVSATPVSSFSSSWTRRATTKDSTGGGSSSGDAAASSFGDLDHYRVLGVPRNATSDNIKEAYRILAKQLHPDIAGTSSDVAEADIRRINDAYAVLSNPRLRAEYDRQRHSKLDKLRMRNEGSGDGSARLHQAAAADAMFQKSLFRANERFRKGAEFRGSMNRANRARIHVPTQKESYMKLAYPLGIVALWGFNYWMFM